MVLGAMTALVTRPPRVCADCAPLVSAPPPFPGEQLFESALWDSGRLHEARFLQTGNGGKTEKFAPGSTPQGPATYRR